MRAALAAIVILLGGACLRPAGAAELALGQQRLTVTGQNTLAYSRRTMTGGALAAQASRYDVLGQRPGLSQRSQLYVRGEVLNDVQVSASYTRGGYGPQSSRFTLTYDGHDTDVAVGDLQVRLDGNAFAPLTKTLVGVKVDARLDRGLLTLLASRSKAPPRTDLFYGRNTSGPYYLGASPIVDSSEQVTVDGARMKRGRDYTLDYQAGILLFESGRIIPPSSQVRVEYEHLSPGGLSGSLLGMRGALPLSDRLDLGATYLTLTRPEAGGSGGAERRDQWTGTNTAGPFPLSYRPVVEGSDRVRVEGIAQTRDVDYRLDASAGLIYFLRPVPMGAVIVVDYRVAAASAASGGDQSVLGFDLRYRPRRHLSLTGQFAASRGGESPADSGAAFGLQAAAEWPGLSVQANWQAVSPSFASIESVGSQRLQSGADVALRYSPRPWATLSASLADYRRPGGDLFVGAGADARVRDRESTFSLEVSPPRWPTLSLRTTRHRIAGAEGDTALSDDTGSDSLGLTYRRTDFGLTAELQRTTTGSALPDAGWSGSGYGYGYGSGYGRPDGGASGVYRATTTSRRLALWYQPGDRLRLTCDLAGNRIHNPGALEDTLGQSSHLGLTYSPSATLALDLDLSSQGTGASRSPDGWQTAESSSTARLVSLRYTPSARTALGLTLDTQRTKGGYIGASDSTGATLSAYLLPRPWLSLNASYGLNRLRYLEASGASTTRLLALAARLGPWRRFTLDLGCNHMGGLNTGSFAAPLASAEAGSASSLGESMLNSSLTARLAYEMSRIHTAFIEVESARAAGYPSMTRRTATALGWEYTMSRLAVLSVDWRHTVHRDLDDSRYNYIADDLNAEVRLTF